MRKYGYPRSGSTLYVRRRRAVRTKRPSFFFKSFIFLFFILLIGGGLFVGGRYVWQMLDQAQIANWHVKTVSVDGISGPIEKEIFTQAAVFESKPFSMADADKLQKQLATQYPMLEKVTVSRGFMSGTLTISAKRREPVAQFVSPDHTIRYVDRTSTVYADPQAPKDVLQVELLGDVPAKLPDSFVDLIQSILKLKKTLPFEALSFNLQNNTVIMRLPDQSVIDFGAAEHLKEKAGRAAQIMAVSKGKFEAPVRLNFAFFDQGKVFLTQQPH